jgi:hypothetical protein
MRNSPLTSAELTRLWRYYWGFPIVVLATLGMNWITRSTGWFWLTVPYLIGYMVWARRLQDRTCPSCGGAFLGRFNMRGVLPVKCQQCGVKLERS